MLRNLLERLTAAARALGRLRAEIAELQQHLVPVLLVAMASAAVASAQSPAAPQERPTLEARVRVLEAELAATGARLGDLAPADATLAASPMSDADAGTSRDTSPDGTAARSELAAIEERQSSCA